MVKVSAIVLFGVLALAPSARADTPAFVNASMCDAAAPIASGATVFSRQIRAVVRPEAAPRRPGKPAAEARAQRRAPAARPAPAAQAEAPAEEAEAALRPAVHFCVTPGGAANPVRYT